MPVPRKRSSPTRLVVALLFAAAGHALVLWLVAVFGVLADWTAPSSRATSVVAQNGAGEKRDDVDDRPIEIQSLVDELREPERKTEAEKREEEKRAKETESKDLDGQVVDIARPPIEERPDGKTRFIAEYDSRVAHETRGKVGHDRAGATSEVIGSTAPTPRRSANSFGNPEARPGLPGQAAPHPQAQTDGQQGQGGDAEAIASDGTARRPGAPGSASRALRLRMGEGGVPGQPGEETHPNLQPTEEMLARAIGKGAGSPDYLRDVDEGESTALNAKMNKYASFFNRVKTAVAHEWHPDVVYIRHDPSGNVYGVKDRVTVLRVNLRPDGTLASTTMRQSSGVEFLDDEAIEAFRRAQPFVHPPAALVEADGQIHFNFGFIFELSGHADFRVLHY